MNDFQKFKEDYMNLREKCKTTPWTLDFLGNTTGKGRLNIVFYDKAFIYSHNSIYFSYRKSYKNYN